MTSLLCDGCKSAIQFYAVLDSAAWETVSRNDYALCASCINDRLEAAGISAAAAFVYVGGRALRTSETPAVRLASDAWRYPEEVAIEGNANPRLYGVFDGDHQ